MPKPLRIMGRPRPDDVPPDLLAFLRQLGGPTWIECPGSHAGAPRLVTAMLHGNEPSGAAAIHSWLGSSREPYCDSVLVVCSVATALLEPVFSHRMIPGQRDANRCFLPPFDDAVGRMAEQLLDRALACKPEALVDLHNNTGRNPPYGVGPSTNPQLLNLTAFFADRFVHSDLTLGTLVEATSPDFPSVSVECGRALDPAADAVALAGMERFLSAPSLKLDAPAPAHVGVLRGPLRVTLRGGYDVKFGRDRADERTLALRADIDRHNFEALQAGTVIGHFRGQQLPVSAQGANGEDCATSLFELREGCLITRKQFIPIMMTLNPDVARSDCLFYAMTGASA